VVSSRDFLSVFAARTVFDITAGRRTPRYMQRFTEKPRLVEEQLRETAARRDGARYRGWELYMAAIPLPGGAYKLFPQRAAEYGSLLWPTSSMQ
jgi:hypothetical protein